MIADAPDITQLIRHILRSTLSLGPARSTYHHAHPRYIHSTIATLRCLTHASLDREPAPSSTWQTLKISRPTDTTVASRKSVPGSARSTVCPFTTKMSMQNAGGCEQPVGCEAFDGEHLPFAGWCSAALRRTSWIPQTSALR